MFAEDYTAYLADFGVIAQGGTCTVNGVSVEGIFDNDFGDIYSVDGTHPSLLIQTANMGSAVRGSAVVITGATSGNFSGTINGIEPDGQGMTRLRLQKT